MVLRRRELRRPHALGDVVSRAPAGRRSPACRWPSGYFALLRSPARWRSRRLARGPRRRSLARSRPSIGTVEAAALGARLPLPRASTAASSRASSRCCSARSSGSPAARCRRSRWSRAGRARASRDRRAPALLRLGRRAGARAPTACRCARSSSRFLLVLGLAVAATAQITGVLLVFALLVAPPATAQQLTAAHRLEPRARASRSRCSIPGSALALAYFTNYPLGFFVDDRIASRALLRGSRRARAGASRADVRACVRAQRAARRLADRARERPASATSSSCARRSSRATRSATSRSPARSPRPPPASTCASGCSPRPCSMALLFAALGERARADDVTIGVVFAWILGLGVLFLDLFNAGSGGGNGIDRRAHAVRLDLRPEQRRGAARGRSSRSASIAATLAIARPLLFASLDPPSRCARRAGARARGALPRARRGRRGRGDPGRRRAAAAGPARRAGRRGAPADGEPYRGMALSAVLALASVWIGIALSYSIAALPPSSAIVLVAGGLLSARVRRRLATRTRAF